MLHSSFSLGHLFNCQLAFTHSSIPNSFFLFRLLHCAQPNAIFQVTALALPLKTFHKAIHSQKINPLQGFVIWVGWERLGFSGEG